jgi:uncharacterized protein YjbI with pentapeptide repeats
MSAAQADMAPEELRVITQDEVQRLIRERLDAADGAAAEFPEFKAAHLADLALQLSTMVMRVNFANSLLERVDATGSNLDGAAFDRTRLVDCNLSELPAARIWAQEAVFESCCLRGTYLRHAHLKRAAFETCDLGLADMAAVFAVGASFRRCHLERTSLELAWLEDADFSGARCGETSFTRSHMRRAKLSGVDLRGCRFDDADLRYATLADADLRDASLAGADLRGAVLTGARLQGADLSHANLSGANLAAVDLTGAKVYGVSAWDVNLDEAVQRGLVIAPPDQFAITVDDLEVAQFVYLIYQNPKIRRVIDTITSRVVLILGRFTPERKMVLDGIRDELRRRDWVPIVFDFDKPSHRDFTETILTLAGMARFVVADISNPKSSPLELQATVPNYMIPFVPILQCGEEPFSMFRDLKQKYGDWVLDILEYDSIENLRAAFEPAIITPALEKHAELMARKAQDLVRRDIRRYLPSHH